MTNAIDNYMISLVRSKVNFYATLILCTVLATAYIVFGAANRGLPWYAVIVLFIIGILFFQAIEYLMHRFLFHAKDSIAYNGHMLHHEDPTGTYSLPWFVPIGISLIIFVVWNLFLPFPVASAISAGMALGYSYYEYTHYSLHRDNQRLSFYRKLKAFHMVHHRIMDTNFGVTTMYWDAIFRTAFRKT
jgi:sterol desaturase/sphingolipid hydroxylase (fatty acid hydroxylase superfamily)